jgi:hypothetical protein
MKPVNEMEYFAPAEQLVEVLTKKTQSDNPLFFRVLVAYYFAKVASMMRTNIKTVDRGDIPVSMYAMNLAHSGHGKGHSTNIIEEHVINQFRDKFLNETYPAISEKNIAKLATQRAIKYGLEIDDMEESLNKEFESLGQLAFSFDSGTPAAVKQMRHKLLMSNAGSLNFEMDEIGSNLLGNVDVLATFLELYDVGKVKQKLTKNTADNKRFEEIDGRTPTNMMLFGTPSKLLNGTRTEEEFNSMLETGYARRCIFGFSKKGAVRKSFTPEEVFDMMTDTSSDTYLDNISSKLGKLADMMNFHTTLKMDKPVSLLLIEYKLNCEKKADAMKEHQEVLKAEISHRYYKALKLAGAYAFIDGAIKITDDHLYNAIKLVEESGEAFLQILSRERNYVKLAKYIASADRELTHVDLVEDLPFYRGGEAQKKDLMSLAVAYGYKNNIIIKKSYSDGIEFLEGESMEETSLDSMRLSYSKDIATDYLADTAPFDELHQVTTLAGYHYTAHHFLDGKRNSASAIQGFNLAIIDIDDGISLESAKLLLKDYKALFATTKSHTDSQNRFRIILPLSHIVKLNPTNYSKFMMNIFNWLPFNTDEATKDIARKWQSHNGHYEYQEGELLDAMLFIPQTRKEEEQSKRILDAQSMNNLERWFYLNTETGNRSNQLIKYALALVDNGSTIEHIRDSILTFNSKLKEGLPEEEVLNTVLLSAMKAVSKRDNGGV